MEKEVPGYTRLGDMLITCIKKTKPRDPGEVSFFFRGLLLVCHDHM